MYDEAEKTNNIVGKEADAIQPFSSLFTRTSERLRDNAGKKVGLRKMVKMAQTLVRKKKWYLFMVYVLCNGKKES